MVPGVRPAVAANPRGGRAVKDVTPLNPLGGFSRAGTIEYVLALLASANVPLEPPPDVYCGDVEFDAKDGHKVVVFYDFGEFDYVDSIVTPNGDRFEYPFSEFQGPDGNPVLCWNPTPKVQ